MHFACPVAFSCRCTSRSCSTRCSRWYTPSARAVPARPTSPGEPGLLNRDPWGSRQRRGLGLLRRWRWWALTVLNLTCSVSVVQPEPGRHRPARHVVEVCADQGIPHCLPAPGHAGHGRHGTGISQGTPGCSWRHATPYNPARPAAVHLRRAARRPLPCSPAALQ